MNLRAYRLPLIGVALVLLSLLAALAYAAFGSRGPSLPDRLSAEFAPLPVREEALFLPAEPDIVPKIILSRQPRSAWSQADAAPFWTDPAGLDQGPLLEAAEKEIRKLFDPAP
jgi:hypothetical protein